MSILGDIPDFNDTAKKIALNIIQDTKRDPLKRYADAKDLIESVLAITFTTGVKWGATAMKEHNDIQAIFAEADLLAKKENSN